MVLSSLTSAVPLSFYINGRSTLQRSNMKIRLHHSYHQYSSHCSSGHATHFTCPINGFNAIRKSSYHLKSVHGSTYFFRCMEFYFILTCIWYWCAKLFKSFGDLVISNSRFLCIFLTLSPSIVHEVLEKNLRSVQLLCKTFSLYALNVDATSAAFFPPFNGRRETKFGKYRPIAEKRCAHFWCVFLESLYLILLIFQILGSIRRLYSSKTGLHIIFSYFCNNSTIISSLSVNRANTIFMASIVPDFFVLLIGPFFFLQSYHFCVFYVDVNI